MVFDASTQRSDSMSVLQLDCVVGRGWQVVWPRSVAPAAAAGVRYLSLRSVPQAAARACHSRRLYILCWSELSRRRLLPAVSSAAGHLTTPTVAGLPGLCENFRPTTSKSISILRLLSSHWATSVVRTRVVGVANVGDSFRRLSSLQHRIYNLLGWTQPMSISVITHTSNSSFRRVGSSVTLVILLGTAQTFRRCDDRQYHPFTSRFLRFLIRRPSTEKHKKQTN